MPSARWWRQAALYEHWGRIFPWLDWSAEAAEAMYAYESRGVAMAEPWGNGYFVGKHWLNWQVTAWREGLAEGTTTKHELLTDDTLPNAAVAMVA